MCVCVFDEGSQIHRTAMDTDVVRQNVHILAQTNSHFANRPALYSASLITHNIPLLTPSPTPQPPSSYSRSVHSASISHRPLLLSLSLVIARPFDTATQPIALPFPYPKSWFPVVTNQMRSSISGTFKEFGSSSCRGPSLIFCRGGGGSRRFGRCGVVVIH